MYACWFLILCILPCLLFYLTTFYLMSCLIPPCVILFSFLKENSWIWRYPLTLILISSFSSSNIFSLSHQSNITCCCVYSIVISLFLFLWSYICRCWVFASSRIRDILSLLATWGICFISNSLPNQVIRTMWPMHILMVIYILIKLKKIIEVLVLAWNVLFVLSDTRNEIVIFIPRISSVWVFVAKQTFCST